MRRGEGVGRRPPHAVGGGLDRFWKIWEGGVGGGPLPTRKQNYRTLVPRPGTSGTLYLFSGNSHEKMVQEKDPGNTWQYAGCAGNLPGT